MRLYAVEALGSMGGTVLSIGVFHFTARHFGWTPAQNFTLAAVQGAVYVVAAMMAGRLAAIAPPRMVLAGLYLLLTVVGAIGALLVGRAIATVAVVLTYTFIIGLSWPILEGLVASGVDARTLARRVSFYNLVWPAT